MNPIDRLRAFWLGVREFRSDWTTRFEELDLYMAYEWGREWAHRLTLRRFDNQG